MEDPESDDAWDHLDDAFSFNLHNSIWLGSAAAVVVTLVVLNMMGVIH